MSLVVVKWLVVLHLLLLTMMLNNKRYLLTGLISLEMLTYFVILVYIIPLLGAMTSMSLFVSLLCVAVSGATVGLCLLISLRRLYGSDLISGFQFAEVSFVWKDDKTS